VTVNDRSTTRMLFSDCDADSDEYTMSGDRLYSTTYQLPSPSPSENRRFKVKSAVDVAFRRGGCGNHQGSCSRPIVRRIYELLLADN